MAKAWCPQCERSVTWYGGRGHRLSDITCPNCSGPLRGRTFGNTREGKPKRVCVVCGKTRYSYFMRASRNFSVRYAKQRLGPVSIIEIKEGDILCWHGHEMEERSYEQHGNLVG